MRRESSSSSIYFLLNQEEKGDEDREKREEPDPQQREDERPPDRTRIDHDTSPEGHYDAATTIFKEEKAEQDESLTHQQLQHHLRGGHGKGTLAFITHPPSPPPRAEWASERFREPTSDGWIHSAPWSDQLLAHLRHERPSPSSQSFSSSTFFSTSLSLSSPATFKSSADQHQHDLHHYHQLLRRRTSWPNPGTTSSGSTTTSGSDERASELTATSNSLPTSPHVRPRHVMSSAVANRGSGSEAAAASARVPSPPSPWAMSAYSSSSSFSSSSYGSFSAPPSPLSAAGAPPSPFSSPSPTARLPSPPMPSWLPPTHGQQLLDSSAEAGSPAGDMSYDKCLQLWTKQTEQRRSHQRVKRWQEFLQRTKPGDGEAGAEGGAERPTQQWIRSRAKRKPSQTTMQDRNKSESDGAGKTNATKERKRKRRAKDEEEERKGEGGRRQATKSNPPEEPKRDEEEQRRTWDFHILRADDIRGQQEGGEEDRSAGAKGARSKE